MTKKYTLEVKGLAAAKCYNLEVLDLGGSSSSSGSGGWSTDSGGGAGGGGGGVAGGGQEGSRGDGAGSLGVRDSIFPSVTNNNVLRVCTTHPHITLPESSATKNIFKELSWLVSTPNIQYSFTPLEINFLKYFRSQCSAERQVFGFLSFWQLFTTEISSFCSIPTM